MRTTALENLLLYQEAYQYKTISAALFIITKNQKQPKCSSTGKLLKKLWEFRTSTEGKIQKWKPHTASNIESYYKQPNTEWINSITEAHT